MGTYAASGGYWISAPADKIYASPTTITGSIGIFGFFMTFENTLSNLGVYSDGVATTDMAGFSITRPLDDKMAQVIQMSVEEAYGRFLNVVADARNMTPEQVDNIAQGRVWIAAKAQELGLIDKLGDKQDAIKAAAALAEETANGSAVGTGIANKQEQKELGWDDVQQVDVIGLEVGYRLIPLVDQSQGGELLNRIKGVRKKLSQELGFLVPPVHIRDNL